MRELSVRCDAVMGELRVRVDVSLTAPWTVLFGPSASGKSSLLRLIAGLWRPRENRVLFDGEDVTRLPAHHRHIGLVAQQAALFPHLDVLGNVRFGCTASPEGAGSVAEILDLFHLGRLQHAPVRQLSGGERQRVALARALAAAPRLLLLDEVFTGMHRAQSNDLSQQVRAHCLRQKIPVLAVTHDVAEALSCAGEVVKMEDGCIADQGAPAKVLARERAALLRQLS